ncbi:MAG: Sphingomyelinase [Acidimicrobiales bacterium]|nr:MAG: hypothetical protein EDR02_01535 [Actinomycetota bacterium]MBV6507212.1 Sphingomyelinase [Acidimicrobiales bacterium]RIK05502.1 MAG: hypothetical protein DCC48_09395 [Acidobacteriota bacterium]
MLQCRAVSLLACVLLAACSGTKGDEPSGSDSTESAEQRSGGLVALTYNVAGLPEGISGSNPSENTELISPLLNDYDLVLVQEDWLEPDPNPTPFDLYHEQLASQAQHPHQSEPVPVPLGSDPDRPEALVSDGLNYFSEFPFEEPVRERWDGCFGGLDTSDGGAADCLSQKGFSVARTTFGDGVVIDVYNLHVEAGDTQSDEDLRVEDMEQLAAFMSDFSAGRPVIVGGDFNLHGDDEGDAAVLEAFYGSTGLSDVCRTLDCPEPERIDRFLFRSSDDVEITPLSWAVEVAEFTRADGEPLSDHDPVAVEFRWTAQP